MVKFSSKAQQQAFLKAPKYFSLCVNIDSQWHIEFGDYDRDSVEAEKDEYVDRYGRQNVVIITSKDLQESIDFEFNKLKQKLRR